MFLPNIRGGDVLEGKHDGQEGRGAPRLFNEVSKSSSPPSPYWDLLLRLGGGRGLAAGPARSFEAVLCDALGGQLRQNIVQVVGVGVAVPRKVGHHLRLVVDVVPHHRVGLAGGAGRPHGEDEAPHPGHLQQLQHLNRRSEG